MNDQPQPQRRQLKPVETVEIVKKAFAEQVDLIRMDLLPVQHWLSTGCTLLDLAVSDRYPGGLAAGRITQIYGRESTAKTILASEPLGSAQRQGGIAFFADAERSFDFSRAPLFGIDCENAEQWRYCTPSTIEELFDERLKEAVDLCAGEQTAKPHVMAVDSLSSLPSKVEAEAKLSDSTFGTTRARQLSTAFRVWLSKINQVHLALIFIDQTRIRVGVQFGNPYTTSGGESLKFYASTRIQVLPGAVVKNKHKQAIGIWVNFDVQKNKVAPPRRTGSFRVLYDYGIDDVASNLQFLKGLTDSKLYEVGERKFKSLDEAIACVEEENFEEELRQTVADQWAVIHQQPVRKTKNRLES